MKDTEIKTSSCQEIWTMKEERDDGGDQGRCTSGDAPPKLEIVSNHTKSLHLRINIAVFNSLQKISNPTNASNPIPMSYIHDWCILVPFALPNPVLSTSSDSLALQILECSLLLILPSKHRHITILQLLLQILIHRKRNRLTRSNPHNPRCNALIKSMESFLSIPRKHYKLA